MEKSTEKVSVFTLPGRMAACLRLVMARGVSWVTAPPIVSFYLDECWSSWAPRCPKSPVAGTVSDKPTEGFCWLYPYDLMQPSKTTLE